MALAAFFVKAHPPALALGKVVFDPHADSGADTGEGKDHQTDQSPGAQADQRRDVAAVEELSGIVQRQHCGLSALDDTCLGPRTAWAGLMATT